jgi:hypothetical protein
MYASATQIQLVPDKIDEAVRIFENDVLPAVKSFQGLQHFYLLLDSATGKVYHQRVRNRGVRQCIL